MIEAVVNGLVDEVPWLRKNRVKFLAGVCLILFLAAIPMITGVRKLFVVMLFVNCEAKC